jgi:cobalt-zinc-cadmium efflux system outer membrane protein
MVNKISAIQWGKPCIRAVIVFCLVISSLASAQEKTMPIWTLENSVKRVLKIAPETQAAAANIRAERGALDQAGAWDNPVISLRADDKIGLENGNGGQELSQFSINQALPLFGTLTNKKSIAQARLANAQAQSHYQNLSLEQQTAVNFHRLQFATANYELAKERLISANKFQKIGLQRAQAGDMATLERIRLDLIRESAKQLLDKEEGEYNEALSQFQAHLNLTSGQRPELAPLAPVENIRPLTRLKANLSQHPLVLSVNNRIKEARAVVELAKSNRLPKFSLSLYRERDFLGGQVQDVNGIGLSFTVPLWDQKRGRLSETRARVDQEQAGRSTLQRDLNSRLQQNYLHLNHLVEMGEHYRLHVFEPSKQVFELTSKAYGVGEVEILSLIDANNTYFDTQSRYLELLMEAWLELAELRLAAGQSIFLTKQDFVQ